MLHQAIFADPTFRFSDPAALFVTPDHYVYRMLASQGVALEALGVPSANGTLLADVSPRDVWRTLAAHMHLFRGTPTGLWLREALASNFNVTDKLGPHNADAMCAALRSRAFALVAWRALRRARALTRAVAPRGRQLRRGGRRAAQREAAPRGAA